MSKLFARSTKRKRRDEEAAVKAETENVSAAQHGRMETYDNKQTVPIPTSARRTDDDNETVPTQPVRSFEDTGLVHPLCNTCAQLGYKRPTPVQSTVIPFLLRDTTTHTLVLSQTGSGKTAAYLLPMLHHLSFDPYGIFAVILSPTRELAKQIHQQIHALGSAYRVLSVLVIGGLDRVQQSCTLQHHRPHVIVATPGRLAALCRGPSPPNLSNIRYCVWDEADRLLNGSVGCGFTKDVAQLVLHSNPNCQKLFVSATHTASLTTLQELATNNQSIHQFVIGSDVASSPLLQTNATSHTAAAQQQLTTNSVSIPEGLSQEYVFMPASVRDAYLLATLRELLVNGGQQAPTTETDKRRKRQSHQQRNPTPSESDAMNNHRAKSCIIFVGTCQRAAMVSGMLEEIGIPNVALHSILSQHRRYSSLAQFVSEQVPVLVCTDLAARGLDIPHTGLVVNDSLPRNPVHYVHRVGRTARAGRRGVAVSLVSETEVALVHAAEAISGRELMKNTKVTDDKAAQMLGAALKAARLTKLKLQDIGFDDLLAKFKSRKAKDAKQRKKLAEQLQKQQAEGAT